jgi:sorting nexin-29
LGKYQCGFRKGKSTVDHIHSLRQILEKTREYNTSTFHLFINFKEAYDSVKRDKLLKAMEEFLIPKKLINLTKATLRNIKCRVKIRNQLSELFTTERGLRQGDALACLLFNVALELAIRKSGIETRRTILHKLVQVLAFADDINIIGRSLRVVKIFFPKLGRSC